MRRFPRENSLSLVLLALFALFVTLQSVTGLRESNGDRSAHGEPEIGYVEYLRTGHFVEAVFENWESEFLQMFAFVVLTVVLRQKGSPESKRLEGHEAVDDDPRRASTRARAPAAVRRGGLALKLYEHSLSLAFLLLFLLSFTLHAAGGAREFSDEQRAHGGAGMTTTEYVRTARFWFESLQNWQSEFLAVGSLVLLSIYLRERGSPESKPVAHPHSETGSE